uniref:Ig-like domain-containing protein n=1 Tax=Astyanax mexicanus TaxID=7994 RepID=A0A3B1J9T8_ASTMX
MRLNTNVTQKPPRPPKLRIITPLKDMKASEGQEIVLNCEVNRPNVTVKWMKAGQEIVLSKRFAYRVDKDKHTLTIKDCTLADEGEYTVAAGADKSTIQLDAKLLAGLTAKAGTKIELPADITGKPEPKVKWSKADLILKEDDRIAIDTKPGHSSVSIAKTTRDDTATYIVEAVNSSGRATATVDVNILGNTFIFISQYIFTHF